MPGLAGWHTALDLRMLLRTFVYHKLSGCFLRWAEKTAKRGEALGGTGLFRGVPRGVPGGVHGAVFVTTPKKNRLISGFYTSEVRRFSIWSTKTGLFPGFLTSEIKAVFDV